MLFHRLRRWSNIETALGECLVSGEDFALTWQHCRANPKGSICLLYSQDTAIWPCRARQRLLQPNDYMETGNIIVIHVRMLYMCIYTPCVLK